MDIYEPSRKAKTDLDMFFEMSKSLKDIFIIKHKKNRTITIFDNSIDVLKHLNIYKYVDNIETMNKYIFSEVYFFMQDFIKTTNKYRTYKDFTVYKYRILNHMLKKNKNKQLNSYLTEFQSFLKSDEIRNFKFNKISKDE